MDLGAIAGAIGVGFCAGLCGGLGVVFLWMGWRAYTGALLVLGAVALVASLAMIAFLLWRTPLEGWRFVGLGVLIGAGLVGVGALGRQQAV